MKKNICKILSLVLLLALVLSFVPATLQADAKEVSEYKGKKVSILGDSISTYSGVSSNASYNSTIGVNKGFYHNNIYGGFTQSDTWWQQVLDVLDMDLLVDNAWGGACVMNARPEQDNVGANSVGYGDRCVNLHNDKTGETPDVIFVFKGTNDFSYFPSTLGTAEAVNYATLITDNGNGSFTYATPTTTCEAYAIMLHKMQQRYPNAEIFCMTLMPRRGNVTQPTAFNTSLKAIAAKFGCGVVDLENCGITSDIATFDKYIADQKVHPNKAGMDLMTQAVVNAMLGKNTPVHDITYNLVSVQENNPVHAVLGGSYSVALTGAPDQVKVTMGGKDITSSVWNGSTVTIPNVTGDVVINAESNAVALPQIKKADLPAGKPANATNIQYLSDLYNSKVVDQLNKNVVLDGEYSSNLYLWVNGSRKVIKGNAETVNGNRTFTINGKQVTFNQSDIALGYNAVKYEKGLGVHPDAGSAAARYIVYDVKGLNVNRFYALVGGTGNNITNPNTSDYKISFELWGSKSASYNKNDFVRLAYVTDLRVYLMGEFDIDITGYNYIKLVVKMSDGFVSNSACAAAWADACVYNLSASTQPTTPSTQPTTPATQPTTPATQPSTEPATEPSVEPSTEPATEPSVEPSAEPSQEPTVAPTTQPTDSQPAATEPSAEDDGNDSSVIWIIVAAVVVVAGVVTAIVLIKKRQQ